MFNNLVYKNPIDKSKIMNDDYIINIFKKCNKYKNNIFDSNNRYTYDYVYAIGDIHGDMDILMKILINIDCIVYSNNNISWNPKAKNICIVQVGDIIDGYRPGIDYKNDYKLNNYTSKDLTIIELLLKLNNEASYYNSKIILLFGNHEITHLFNVMNDYKLFYNNLNDKSVINTINNEIKQRYIYSIKDLDLKNAKLFNKRLKNIKNQLLCNYHTIVIVNNYLFCHSGFVLKIMYKLFEQFNIPKSEFIKLEPSDKVFIINICATAALYYIMTNKIDKTYIKSLKKYVINIFHHRIYQNIIKSKEELTQNDINIINSYMIENKQLFNIKGMIIGHNVIKNYKINKIDDLYGIDIGLSTGFNIEHDTIQYIKITNNNSKEIKEIHSNNSNNNQELEIININI